MVFVLSEGATGTFSSEFSWAAVAALVGLAVGSGVGALVGLAVGSGVGALIELAVGSGEGALVGLAVGYGVVGRGLAVHSHPSASRQSSLVSREKQLPDPMYETRPSQPPKVEHPRGVNSQLQKGLA